MPCWTVQQSEVKLSGLNPEFLKAALLALGFRVNDAEYSARFDASITADRFTDHTSVVVHNDGRVTVNAASARDWGSLTQPDLAAVTNEVKRAYAVQVVHAAAKKFGWNMKQTSETKFAVTRRF